MIFFRWVAGIFALSIFLFIGSALVAGVMERNEQDAVMEKANQLTDISGLQGLVKERLDVHTPLACLYIGAISFRLAEARDLKIDRERAIDLANDQYLVQGLALNGFNPKSVIRGLSQSIYDSPLSPQKSFDTQVQACIRPR